MTVRVCKILLLVCVGAYLALVTFNNVTDYGSNLPFVVHVLSMDTTFEANQARWRALHHPVAHHVAYLTIITWEAIAAGLTLTGAARLWRQRRTPAAQFQQQKNLAVIGLTVGLLLWFGAFLVVGGEWFLMWQSRIWNGQTTASRLAILTGVILLILLQRDDEVT